MAKEGLQLRSLVKASGELELSLAKVADRRPRRPTRSWCGSRRRRSIRPISACCSARPTCPRRSHGAGDTRWSPRRSRSGHAGHGRPRRPVDAGRQRRRGRGGRGGRGAASAGAAGQDCRHPRRRDVRAVPHREGRRRPGAARRRDAADGASCFVNPLTALGMVETMRREGHTALVHTAAASNLGQMLVKICPRTASPWSTSSAAPSRRRAAEPRRQARRRFQRAELHGRPDRGADGDRRHHRLRRHRRRQARRPDPDRHGGRGQPKAGSYSRYGSTTHKQVYIYGGLDTGPTELNRAFGMAWGLGGWLLTPFL